ncbi:MAG: ATP-binding protein [Limnochordia bacterium]|jgi:Holliday junction DNA helicase RuvB|nr:ATP-binding protein [Limnochordia bacterium]
MKESDIGLLRQIAAYEDTIDWTKPGAEIGWEWRDVRIATHILNRLYLEGYLDNPFKSNSCTGYRLSEKGKQAVQGISEVFETEATEIGKLDLPQDLFTDIIGHGDVKDLLRAALCAEKPVHVLLVGPPALAKTLFLWDIERACGELACWLVGSAASKAGLWDLVVLKRPRLLLIDELDKMSTIDTAALLSMMEGGRLVRAKKGRELELTHQIWVVATSNRLQSLSPELLSRFAIRRISAYSRADYVGVVKGVLVHREDVSPEVAEEIAQRLDGRSQDVRDAIRVARLAPELGVDKAIRLLIG